MLNAEMSIKWMLSSVQERAVWIIGKDLQPCGSHAACGWLASLKRCSNSRLSSEAERWAVGAKWRMRRHRYYYQQTKKFNQTSQGYSLTLITKSFPLPSHHLCLHLAHPSFFFVFPLSLIFHLYGGWIRLSCILCMLASLCPIAFVPRLL